MKYYLNKNFRDEKNFTYTVDNKTCISIYKNFNIKIL